MNIIIESRTEIVRVLETYLDIILKSPCFQMLHLGSLDTSETTEALFEGALRQRTKRQGLKELRRNNEEK